MNIFTENKTAWIVGVSCAFLPTLSAWFINRAGAIADIPVPFWLICFVVSSPIAYLIAAKCNSKIKNVANKKFGVEKVKICGKYFVNCTFNGTELEYDSTADTSMSHCSLTGQRITFSGGALRTMHYLIALYSDPAFRPIVEKTLENIRDEGLKKTNQT